MLLFVFVSPGAFLYSYSVAPDGGHHSAGLIGGQQCLTLISGCDLGPSTCSCLRESQWYGTCVCVSIVGHFVRRNQLDATTVSPYNDLLRTVLHYCYTPSDSRLISLRTALWLVYSISIVLARECLSQCVLGTTYCYWYLMTMFCLLVKC